MAPRRQYFTKDLTATDIAARLSWPSRLLPRRLPGHQAARYRATFQVRDGDGRVWEMHCSTRQRGYYKPVITGDWLRFVQSKSLMAGDRVVLYEDPNPGARFVVAVRRLARIRLLGQDVIGYTDEE